MAIGNRVNYEEGQDRSGEITRRLVPFEQPTAGARQEDMKKHYQLSGAFAPGSDLAIVVNQVIRIRASIRFEKYRVLVRNSNADGFIGLDRDATSSVYDDVCIGASELEDRCEFTEIFSIVFPIVPVDPVDVWLYAGAPARSL